MRILVVEDEKKIADFIKRGLKEEGYAVDAAYDGAEGQFLAKTNNYDLILLDLMLPKIEGFKVCRMLKFDKDYSHIPIIILTARSQPVEEEVGYSTGANLYLTKPFDGNELVTKVKELLKEIE